MYDSEDSKYTVRVNKYFKHMNITETRIKLLQFRNDCLYPIL